MPDKCWYCGSNEFYRTQKQTEQRDYSYWTCVHCKATTCAGDTMHRRKNPVRRLKPRPRRWNE